MVTAAKRTAQILAAAVAWTAICGMEVMEHRQELGTLKEQSQEGPRMEEALEKQEASFLGVAEALRTKALAKGAAGRDVSSRYGSPVTVSPGPGGEQWMYRSRHGKRLQTPWVFLYFGEDGRLRDWKCARTDCG